VIYHEIQDRALQKLERFNEQYQSIYQFLLKAGTLDYNEHFHWGRFE